MKRTRLLLLLVLLMTAATGAWAQDVWTDIIINGDLEGADRQCFFVKENGLGNVNIYYARIKDGIGVDNSRAIEVQSTGTEAQTWDTQFFVRLPYELPANTSYKVSFDYKADKTGECDLQAQNEPGEYIWYTIGVSNSAITFGNGWSNFNSGDITVPQQCDGLQNADGPHLNNFQTISFSLGKNGEATKYIIDNIKVEIPSDVLSGLTKKPLTKEMSQYPVEITSMAIMGDFLGQSEVNNWNPTNGWALTQDNSNPAIWKLTREFTAVARTYEYKIFANGNMDDFTLPVPADDKGQFVISEAGDYILTVTVDTEAGTASVRAAVPGTYNVTFAEGIPEPDKWSASPNTDVKKGQTVTVTYTGTRKVIGVKAEKKAKAPAYPMASEATAADYGKVVCAAGHLHDAKTAVPEGCTAVAVFAYIDGGNKRMGIALQDAENATWNMITTDGAYNNTLCAVPGTWNVAAPTDAEWFVGTKEIYEAIFTNLGSTTDHVNGKSYDDNVNAFITTGVGGTALSDDYWCTTSKTTSLGWKFSGIWSSHNKTNTNNVRPVLGF